MDNEIKSRTLIFLELAGDVFSVGTKILMGILSHSAALIAEGLHSLTDTANHLFLLVGIETSKKPADKDHPFGYGKERFFWSFLAALFILTIAGGVAIWQGIKKIQNPVPITNFKASFLVLGGVLVCQLFLLNMTSQHYRSLVGKVKNLKELFLKMKFVKEPTAINLWLGDVAAVFGNLLAALALFLVLITKNVIYDGLASIVIGGILAGLGFFLIQDTKKLLIGEAVSPAMYEEIIEIVENFPEVKGIVKLKTMHLTPNEILINADIDFQDDLETSEIEMAIDKIENAIKSKIPAAKQISIEVESKK